MGLQPSEMLEVVANSILSCCPRNPHGHERVRSRRRGKEEEEEFRVTVRVKAGASRNMFLVKRVFEQR